MIGKIVIDNVTNKAGVVEKKIGVDEFGTSIYKVKFKEGSSEFTKELYDYELTEVKKDRAYKIKG